MIDTISETFSLFAKGEVILLKATAGAEKSMYKDEMSNQNMNRKTAKLHANTFFHHFFKIS